MAVAKSNLCRWLEAAAGLEDELLDALPQDDAIIDGTVRALNAGGHLRLVVDIPALGEPRLRVRMCTARGGWWLLDTCGSVAPPARLDALAVPG